MSRLLVLTLGVGVGGSLIIASCFFAVVLATWFYAPAQEVPLSTVPIVQNCTAIKFDFYKEHIGDLQLLKDLKNTLKKNGKTVLRAGEHPEIAKLVTALKVGFPYYEDQCDNYLLVDVRLEDESYFQLLP